MEPRLGALIAEMLDLSVDEIRPDMRRSETEAWDSLTHLRLMTAIEQTFGATFTMDEIANIQTPAELQSVLDRQKSPVSGA